MRSCPEETEPDLRAGVRKAGAWALAAAAKIRDAPESGDPAEGRALALIREADHPEAVAPLKEGSRIKANQAGVTG